MALQHHEGGTRWRNWLRHCAATRKVTGSIPDGVIGVFHWHYPSGRTMALGLTQPLTEMSTSTFTDNHITFMCWLSWNLVTSTSWNPQGLSRPVTEFLYLLQNHEEFSKCRGLFPYLGRVTKAELRNEWSSTWAPPFAFLACLRTV
jgi:hypothetical protein